MSLRGRIPLSGVRNNCWSNKETVGLLSDSNSSKTGVSLYSTKGPDSSKGSIGGVGTGGGCAGRL